MPRSIKILLLGDYSIFRSALRVFLETRERLKVVGETSDSGTAMEIVAIEKPDLILVDLPDCGDTDLLKFLQTSKVPVLILVGPYDLELYRQCFKTGVSALIHKEESGETLFQVIEKVYHGGTWFNWAIMGETIRTVLEVKEMSPANADVRITDGPQNEIEWPPADSSWVS